MYTQIDKRQKTCPFILVMKPDSCDQTVPETWIYPPKSTVLIEKTKIVSYNYTVVFPGAKIYRSQN